MSVGVAECFDQYLKNISNFGALDNATNVFDSLEGCSMDLFVGIVEHLSYTFDYVWQVATNLLGCAVCHCA